MSEEQQPSFQPHSDEELAHLLEEQMRLMRGTAPAAQTPVPPTEQVEVTPSPFVESPGPEVDVAEEAEDTGIDELFGALLEDTSEVVVVQETVVEQFQPVVDESTLEHTQPITYIAEETVTAAVIDDHVVVEDVLVEDVVEDAQVIAERILSEISVDGLVVATTIAETAGPEPIPQMFGEVLVSQPVPVVAPPVLISPVQEAPPVEYSVPVVEEVVEEVLEVDVVAETEVPRVRSNNPLSSFAPRPTFDELVFGANSDD
ncbi:hypothetical protein [Aurantimicrobium sp. MWH-Uga1]|uniref:hypothetical protein n=1 Tax=Aurantimicrobium sp. MWH-Uga1 TaxID=2079575 RepID=UPI000DED9C11|nr:hypothetical protein [Aurantimicrobium sp. MWH-Uga1]AXE54622.1 hypothetical protein AURUGA1_00936 [Aurantimicrobium sp. MWH-Uga1]